MQATGMTPPDGGMPPQGGVAPQPPTDNMGSIQQALQNLSPEEMEELDSFITPRFAELLVKAFGPGMMQLVGPFLQDDSSDEAMDVEPSIGLGSDGNGGYTTIKQPSAIRNVTA